MSDTVVDLEIFSNIAPEHEIKRGENGGVCLVRDTLTRKRMIYRFFAGDAQVYRLLCGVRCPNLPRIYEVKEKDGVVYVLEEFIQGDTLSFLLEKKPLDPRFAAEVLIQTARAANELHRLGAVHRDIKPENIILRGDQAVLIDFDAARILKPENDTDTRVMGTTGYAAPEQYGFSQTDARADIYALGILLNEMLTKAHPSRQLAEGRYRTVIEKCTQINADRRYKTADELIAAVKAAARRYRKVGICAASVLLCAVLLVGCVFFLGGFPSGEQFDVFEREQRITPKELWSGPTEGYGTYFTGDMNGDGTEETYLFGAAFDEWFNDDIIYHDINSSYPGCEHIRYVFPCVWRVEEDGTRTVAPEFADLLKEAQITVWRVNDTVSKSPHALTAPHKWPGYTRVNFITEADGMWLYEVTAKLEGEDLTAAATTTFYFGEFPG